MMEGLHGWSDFHQMVTACHTVWVASKGYIFAVRHANPHPRPDPYPDEPVDYPTFILETFHGDCFNDKVAEEFMKLVDIEKYKAVSYFMMTLIRVLCRTLSRLIDLIVIFECLIFIG